MITGIQRFAPSAPCGEKNPKWKFNHHLSEINKSEIKSILSLHLTEPIRTYEQ